MNNASKTPKNQTYRAILTKSPPPYLFFLPPCTSTDPKAGATQKNSANRSTVGATASYEGAAGSRHGKSVGKALAKGTKTAKKAISPGLSSFCIRLFFLIRLIRVDGVCKRVDEVYKRVPNPPHHPIYKPNKPHQPSSTLFITLNKPRRSGRPGCIPCLAGPTRRGPPFGALLSLRPAH